MRKVSLLLVVAFGLASPARADGVLRIGFIDPLSGPGATAGEVGLKTWQFLAGKVNAQGGIDGKKVDIVSYDNKLNAQETTIQAQKAIDSGIRLLARSNGGAVGVALSEYLGKFNERNPGKQTLYFDYSGTDMASTNEKCIFGHVRWAANLDMKVSALISHLKAERDLKRVFILNQDYSTGQGVRSAAKAGLREQRPDVEIVGDELIPLMKVADFAPYIEKIKASGADSIITGLWGQDLALALKAAGEAGLKAKWYTFFAQGIGSPTAVRQSGLPPHVVFEVYEGHANVPSPAYADEEKRFRSVVGSGQTIMYPGAINAMNVFADTANTLKTTDVMKIMAAMEGKHFKTFAGEDAWIRAEDHQVFQPLYVASLGPLEPGQTFDEEGTGWGWKQVAMVPAGATLVPTTCKMKRPN